MIGLALAAAAPALALERAPDFWRGEADRAAYVTKLAGSVLESAGIRHRAPCPSNATLRFQSLDPVGPASEIIGLASDLIDPAEIVYRERFLVEGCGCGTTFDNIFTVRTKAGQWFMVGGLPGATAASPKLAMDVMALSQPLSQAGVTCASQPAAFRMTDTAIVARSVSPFWWQERWTQSYCDQDTSVLVKFMPGPMGVTFDVELATPGKAGAAATARPDKVAR